MLIYFHGNFAFSLPDFMIYGASLWDTIRLLHLPPLLQLLDARDFGLYFPFPSVGRRAGRDSGVFVFSQQKPFEEFLALWGDVEKSTVILLRQAKRYSDISPRNHVWTINFR